MAERDEPRSYKDPRYDTIEERIEREVGIPRGLLKRIRTRGERSNADQVSEAGARSVYQIIPTTRSQFQKKYGVDAYAGPEQAARVAALHLKESLGRNDGSVPAAVAEYHGGTSRANWGSRTKSYVARVTRREQSGGSAYDRVMARRAERDEGSQIERIFDAYRRGQMSPQEAAQFETDVNAGRIILPRGGKLKRTPSAPTLPPSVVKAYNARGSGMTPEERAQIEQDIENGVVALPKGAKLAPPAPRSTMENLGLGVRNIATGAGALLDIVGGPVNAIVNALPGKQGLSLTPAQDAANKVADAVGLAKPETPAEELVKAVTEGATGGLATAGAGTLASGARGATGVVARSLAANPVLDTATGATSALSGELAQQAGAGPVGQIAASVLGGGVALGTAGAGRRMTQRANRTAIQVAESVPARVVLDEAGELTEDGLEIAAREGINPQEMRGAYRGPAPANDIEAPVAREAPNGAAQPEAIAPGGPAATASAVSQADDVLPADAAARLAEAASEKIPLTRGQATQDYGLQDAEQTLRSAASSEGEQARVFLQQQQEAISDAVQRYRSGFDDPEATPQQRGEIVKGAIEELRDQGKAGVTELYKRAEELGGEGLGLLTDGIEDVAQDVLMDEAVPEAVKRSISQQLARYGLVGKAEKMNEVGITRVKLDDGTTISFRGEVEPLTISNAESLRQAVNRLYMSDPTHRSQALKPAIDDAVEEALVTAAEKGVANAKSREVANAYEAARAAHKTQRETFSAKDVVQRLIDWKKGTKTPVVIPEKAVSEVLKDVDSLKRVKAVLLAKPTIQSKAAWQAIKGQGVAQIFDKAKVVNSNLGGAQIGAISGSKLNSEITRFGADKLRVLLDTSEFNQLMKLRRIIGNATIPISGTTNPSGTAAKVMKFLTPLASRLIPFGNQAMQVLGGVVRQARDVAQAQETLRGVKSYTPAAAAKDARRGASKASTPEEAADEQAREFLASFVRLAEAERLVPSILSAGNATGLDGTIGGLGSQGAAYADDRDSAAAQPTIAEDEPNMRPIKP